MGDHLKASKEQVLKENHEYLAEGRAWEVKRKRGESNGASDRPSHPGDPSHRDSSTVFEQAKLQNDGERRVAGKPQLF